MLKEKYLEAITAKIHEVYNTQKTAIEKAAEIIVDSVVNGGNIHVYDSGHIVDSELINRAGGLAMLKQLKYTLTINNPVNTKGREKKPSLEGIGKIVLTGSNAQKGDVLIIGSVSGRSYNLIDLANEALKMGLKLIVITSLQYSGAVESEHAIGKKLYEMGDVVIDNCAPKGDAMIEIDGIENKYGAASGLCAAFALWCVSGEIIDIMQKRDLNPTLFRSVNFPGGWDDYHNMCKRYEEIGY